MAFPTSPSNNDVHKEGNRAFVYDSTLGVWDQVKETDRLFAEAGGGAYNMGTGVTIGSGVSFPAGHVLQVINKNAFPSVNSSISLDSSAGSTETGLTSNITCSSTGNSVYVIVTLMCYKNHAYSWAYGYKLLRDIAGGTSDVVRMEKDYYYNNQDNFNGADTTRSAITYIEDVPTANVVLTYHMQQTSHNTSAATSNAGNTMMTLMEIKGNI